MAASAGKRGVPPEGTYADLDKGLEGLKLCKSVDESTAHNMTFSLLILGGLSQRKGVRSGHERLHSGS
jgi:hypothetical protein